MDNSLNKHNARKAHAKCVGLNNEDWFNSTLGLAKFVVHRELPLASSSRDIHIGGNYR
jgi:hypothetical protein